MGDRVAVPRDGILQQCATPRGLFTKPANTFVAGFIGSPAMNMLQCTATPDGLSFAGVTLPITAIEELGSDSFVYCTPTGQPMVTLVARTHGLNASSPSETVHLMPDVVGRHVFDTASGARLEG